METLGQSTVQALKEVSHVCVQTLGWMPLKPKSWEATETQEGQTLGEGLGAELGLHWLCMRKPQWPICRGRLRLDLYINKSVPPAAGWNLLWNEGKLGQLHKDSKSTGLGPARGKRERRCQRWRPHSSLRTLIQDRSQWESKRQKLCMSRSGSHKLLGKWNTRGSRPASTT